MADPIHPEQDFTAYFDKYLSDRSAVRGAPPPDTTSTNVQGPLSQADFSAYFDEYLKARTSRDPVGNAGGGAAPVAPAEPVGIPAPMPRPAVPGAVVEPIAGPDTQEIPTPESTFNIGLADILDPFGTTRALGSGLQSGVTSSMGALNRVLGNDPMADELAARAQAQAPAITSYGQVTNLAEAGQLIASYMGQSLPEMVAVGAVAAGATAVAGPGAGIAAALATSTAFNAGRNLERQQQEDPEADPSFGIAVTAGLGQAGLDVIVPGKWGRVFGSRLAGIAEVAAGKLMLKKEVAKDAATEMSTEVVQQLMEIGQANPELLRVLVAPQTEDEVHKSDMLLTELIDSGLGGLVGGAGFSTLAGALADGHGSSTVKAKDAMAPQETKGPETNTIATSIAQGDMTDNALGTEEGVLMLPAPTEAELAKSGVAATPVSPSAAPGEVGTDGGENVLGNALGSAVEKSSPPEIPGGDTVPVGKGVEVNGLPSTPKKKGYAELKAENDAMDAAQKVIQDTELQKIGITPELSSTSDRVKSVELFVRDQLRYPGFEGKNRYGFTSEEVGQMGKALLDAGAPAELVRNLRTLRFNEQRFGAVTAQQVIEEIGAYGELRNLMDNMGLPELPLLFKTKPGAGHYTYPQAGRSPFIAINIFSAPDIHTTVGHEVLHAIKSLGVFQTGKGAQVWKLMSDYADQMPTQGWIAEYKPEQQHEEKVAELLGTYTAARHLLIEGRRGKDYSRAMQAFAWVRELFDVAKNWAHKHTRYNPQLIAQVSTKLNKPWHALEYIASGQLNSEIMKSIGGKALTDAMAVTNGMRVMARELDVKPETRERLNAMVNHADYYNAMVKWGWNVLQLAKKNLHIGWLQHYVQLANQWYNEKSKWLARADETVGAWNNLSLPQQNALASLIFDIEQMGYRTPQEVAQGVRRKPTRNELAALIQKHQITKEAFEVYLKMRADFDAVLDKLEQLAIRDAIRIMPNNLIGQQLAQAQIKQEFRSLRKAPYFPHARFGNLTTVVKDSQGKTVYMETFEREADRGAAEDSIVKQFPAANGFTVGHGYLSQETVPFRGLPPSLLVAIQSTLKLSPTQQGELEQLMLQMSPTQSFKNHFVRKQNIAGYSQNALRAYADYFWHGANHIARLEFGPLMQDAIKDGQGENSKLIASGFDTTKRGKMVEYLQHHMDNILNPQPDWAAARSLGFLWWLGFNVKSAVTNLSQVPLVTYPYLGALFGDAKAVAEISKAYAQLNSIYRNPTKANSTLTAADSAQLSLGIQQGFLDESFAQELAGIAEGGNLLKTQTGSRMHKLRIQFNVAAGALFQVAEKANRRVAFMAAVNLARANPNAKAVKDVITQYSQEYSALVQSGLSPTEAAAFFMGKEAVRSTQFEYSAYARPRFMEGRKSAFFTFFMFQQNMLWFIQNSPGNTRYLILLLATAGIMGLPGAEDLEAIAKWLGRRLHRNWDMDKELRELITDVTDAPPDVFLHGISRYSFGLSMLGDMTGTPIPAFDFSGNIGMGSPVPLISPLIQGMTKAGDWNDKLAATTQEGVGATFGIGLGFLQALTDDKLAVDDPKRWEKAMPAAVANASKGYRLWRDGNETARDKSELVDFDRTNPEHIAEIVGQSLGFLPTRKSQGWDRVIQQREAGLFWQTRRGLLLSQYNNALDGGDAADKASVIEAIKRYNTAAPGTKLKISNDTLKRSRAAKLTSRSKHSANLPDAAMLGPVYRDIARLHPEAKNLQTPTLSQDQPTKP